MGLLKATPQKDGTQLIEIVYGGAEAPFGGIDTSAPPAYIDPKCFVDAINMAIVDNKLLVASMQEVLTPTLFSNVPNVNLIGFGNFFNAYNTQLNYALGYTSTPITGPPSGVNYVFYMTAWDPSNISDLFNDTLAYTLWDSAQFPVAASLTLGCFASGGASTATGSGAIVNISAVNSGGGITALTVSGGLVYVAGQNVLLSQGALTPSAFITVNTVGGSGNILTFTLASPGGGYKIGPANAIAATFGTTSLHITGPSGAATYTVTTASLATATPAAMVTAMAAAINAGPDLNVTAAPSLDGNSLVLTSIIIGVVGNSVEVTDTSSNTGGPPNFYFPPRDGEFLEGGLNPVSTLAPRTLQPASIVADGNTLYIGNVGPVILSYAGPGQFAISSIYAGYSVLGKFGGSLIGLGTIVALGSLVQNPEMIFSWSAANNLNEWNPVNSQGFVTGAGFAQLADISESLTGIVVSNNTAWIIRQQGLTYVTATGNGVEPFSFNNVSLGSNGEGAQIPTLVVQYDQAGMYIGNTNVYGLTQGITPMGEKIKKAIFDFLSTLPDPITTDPTLVQAYLMSAAACGVQIGGEESVTYAFMLGTNVYTFNAQTQVWMKMVIDFPAAPHFVGQGILGTLSNSGLASPGQGFRQGLLTLGRALYNSGTAQIDGYDFYNYQEGVGGSGSLSITGTDPTVTFPIEEIMHGRNITLDSLYVSIQAAIPGSGILSGIGVVFTLYGQVIADGVSIPQVIAMQTLDLTSDQFPGGVDGNPTEFQIFSDLGSFTINSPQLQITIGKPLTGTAQVRFTKISLFGSFDPNQRPV